MRWMLTWMMAVLACAAGVGGCRKSAPADLVILTPHSKQIQGEFDQAFRRWHKAAFGQDVTVEWRNVGGGTASTQWLAAQYAQADSSGVDVYFGAGAPDHRLLADKGILVTLELPKDILDQLPSEVGGVQQYDPQHRWFGATLSCFGIIYNSKLLAQQKLPIPAKWEDLARPEMFNKVSAADAGQSSSARTAYEMIVQSSPDWPAGWAKLLKIFANCKHYTGGASEVVTGVANGEVLAGAAIDFYAHDQIAFSGSELGFVVVQGTTAFTPDPIAVCKGAPHAQAAQRFVEFVLGPRGQALWCLPAGAPDGPAANALYRQPIRRDTYTQYAGKMLPVLVDPFGMSAGFKLDEVAAEVRVNRLYDPLMRAAAIDNKDLLAQAWKKVIDAGQPEELVKELVALPPDLADQQTALATAAKLSDPKVREQTALAWQKFFREKYQRIIGK